MRAVILAAGRGGRLRDVTGDRPKCLARIGDRMLIERQIRSLRACGIEAITVVAGYRAADVRRSCGAGVDVLVNARHASTNSLYSLWLARDLLRDGFVVLNCDVLFPDQMLRDLLSSRDEDALLMAAPRGQEYGEEEMKVRVRRGCVVDMSKDLDPAETDGENVGIAKFGAAGACLLVEEAEALVDAGALREWLPRAFAAFARKRPLYVVETRGYPWIEIDFPEDYWRACADVLPAIADFDATADRRRASLGPARATASGRTLHHV
ncbi:MAG TPA: phosphocholine cytidylyltransferase family protein [Vicinamibacterales bacterium]|nr:phosphocholine cytidylyltransferase family protein [Vicinamibacterales bacterium]